jgi:phytoene dehydrogenase-like protein
MSDPVVIVGAGLSGLTAAKLLSDRGIEVILLDGADQVGGRVRTDEVDGFLLDRGFQVLLTAYPEAQKFLDYRRLDLQRFEPGSLIRTDRGFETLADPWRRPLQTWKTLTASIGGLMDKLRIGRLRHAAGRGTVEEVFRRPDRSTEEELRKLGFSESMIDGFLRPFLGGVFLDHDLQTSCRMLYFVFRMFSQGEVALPAAGMGAIASQLASQLPEASIRLRAPVASVGNGAVQLEKGGAIPYRQVLIATDQVAAARLLPELSCSRVPRSVRCVYFAAPEPPVRQRMLVLNGTGRGLVNNLCVPSQIASSYAPADRSLISATVLKDGAETDSLQHAVRQELREWFGGIVDSWTHLRTYHIPYALPNQATPAFDPPAHSPHLRDRIYVCGDYRVNGSINGAMQSGRLAAEAICAESP